MTKDSVTVVIPNWNGEKILPACLDSLKKQTLKSTIVVVDNGSTDNSVKLVERDYPEVVLIRHHKNLGFTGGVNAGIRYALEHGSFAVALFNSDAVAEPDWLKHLSAALKSDPKRGIVTGKIFKDGSNSVDNTGENFSSWGLPFARSRDKKSDDPDITQSREIFGASGGSTLYRCEMLKAIGLFDNDFFAYYEDADMNFRALLSGWKSYYESSAVVHHQIGGTSSRMSGFTTYHTVKNLPWVIWKNVPGPLFIKLLPKFTVAYLLILGNALLSRNGLHALKGFLVSLIYLPKKLWQRHSVQKLKTVQNSYIEKMFYPGPPPQSKLRKLFGRDA